MYKIATLNKIAPIGLNRFSDKYVTVDGEAGLDDAVGVLVRSQNMLDMTFGENLLAIARAGAGVNNIPLDKCADHGIVVFNTPGANANSVKELVLASILVASRNMSEAISWVNALPGEHPEDMSKAVEKGKSKFAGHEILGRTLGVLGLGAIGALVANSARALGMNVVGYDPFLTPQAAARLDSEVKVVDSPEDLLPLCDYVTLHIPATTDTTGMVNTALLSHFKDGAVLLNFSRDKLVNEADILAAIESGKLARYVTDFATEGIIGKPGVTCTPHLGASTEEAEDNCAMMAVDEIMDFIDNGNIRNSVNYPAINAGPLADATRVVLLTKGEPNPDKLAAALFADKKISSCVGNIRGDYGAAILDTPDAITEVPAVPEVLKVRVITRD